MSRLVFPDTATMLPVGTATTHPHTRRPLGRRNATSVDVLAQMETIRSMRSGGEIIERDAESVILFDAPPLAPSGAAAGYTPARGDRLVSIVHAETGATETIGLYLSDVKPDAAGGVVRCKLSSREPERVAL